MRIALASDHAGYAEKERLKPLLTDLGVEFDDLGTQVSQYLRAIGTEHDCSQI